MLSEKYRTATVICSVFTTIIISIANVLSQKYVTSITQAVFDAGKVLILISKINLISSLLSQVLFFSRPITDDIVINTYSLAFIFISSVAMFWGSDFGVWVSLMIVVIYVFRDYAKIFGCPFGVNRKSAAFYFFSVLCAVLIALVLFDFSRNGKIFVSLFFALQCLPILLFKGYLKKIRFSVDDRDFQSILTVILAEFFPFAAGYLLLIFSSTKLSVDEFIKLREGLAVLGVSNIFGGLALSFFTRGYILTNTTSFVLLFLAFSSILIAVTMFENITAKVFVLTVTAIASSINHSCNKVYLDRRVYFLVSSVGSVLVILWQITAKGKFTAVGYLYCAGVAQFIHVVASFISRFRIVETMSGKCLKV